MSRKILLYFFVISTVLTSSVYAASYEDGEVAYNAKRYKEAVAIWDTLAQQGDITAQLRLAKMYSTGAGVKVDKAASFKFYNQAAEQGSLAAQVQLGQIYMSGQKGVKQDRAKARELYRQAAYEGYAEAQYYYGRAYFYGEGVTTDYVQAYAWMLVAKEYRPAKTSSENLAEVLSKADIKKAKKIADQLLAEIKKEPAGNKE